jgi:hypothetical protein
VPSIADTLLSQCASHVEALHGEPIAILSGADAGKSFVGVVEVETDQIISTELGEDARPRVFIRFLKGNVPAITGQARVQTSDGKVWLALRNPGNGYLTTDFELRELTAKDA